MKVLLLALVALLPFALASSRIIDASNIDSMWGGDLQARLGFSQFKAQWNKTYESAEMEEYRFGIFKANMQRAAELQKLNPTAEFGVTRFSDLEPVEFQRQYLNFRPAVGESALLRKAASVRKPSGKCTGALPGNFDWRAPDGGRVAAVTAVKDQGRCGSCWAFSAVETLESAWILAGNKPVALSTQQVVSCDSYDGGCNGGDLPSAYKYIQQAGGVSTEAAYPYVSGNSGSTGRCALDASTIVAKMSGWEYATPACFDACKSQDEEKLKQNLYEAGPVAVCVDATAWQSYRGGVMTPSSGCRGDYRVLNHCVQLTGYGVDSTTGQEFWSMRNSWSSAWGEQGFIRVLYGQNTCGLADEAIQVQI